MEYDNKINILQARLTSLEGENKKLNQELLIAY
jgi:hypothetical protein